jgi:type II secretory pathway component PulK
MRNLALRKCERRGFAFVLVLMLLVVCGILVGASLQRASVSSMLATKQAEGYRKHHEMLGIRDYGRSWLQKPEHKPDQLAAYAESGEVAHRFVLDSNVVILISVRDGQGTVLRSLANVTNAETRRWLVEVLSRVPLERTDLTRRSGPPQISLHSASDEVLDAVAGFDDKVSAGLREARDKGASNPTELQQALQRRNVEDMVAHAVSQYVTFEPSLWRLNVEVVYPEHVNRYTLLAEKRNNLVTLHEWRPVGDSEAERLFGEAMTQTPGGVSGQF